VAPLVPAIQIEVNHRDEGPHYLQARRVLAARRIVLLATISGLAAGVVLAGSGVQFQVPKFSSVQAAENTQRIPASPMSWTR
jgi:hypothetical protein